MIWVDRTYPMLHAISLHRTWFINKQLHSFVNPNTTVPRILATERCRSVKIFRSLLHSTMFLAPKGCAEFGGKGFQMHVSKLVHDVDEIESLDESDLLLGYAAGFDGLPVEACWSKSFLHGWRNGMLDSGYGETEDDESRRQS